MVSAMEGCGEFILELNLTKRNVGLFQCKKCEGELTQRRAKGINIDSEKLKVQHGKLFN